MSNELSFETSRELRRYFTAKFEDWSKKERLGMSDLAERCGVSNSYLSQVSRYGRIPGKPVLILLALNLNLPNPSEILKAAGINESWPYDRPVKLIDATEDKPGFLSLRLDMQGLTDAIRDMVKQETRPRTVKELTRGKPLRIGFNFAKSFYFSSNSLPTDGFFPELCRLLALSLQVDIEPKNIHFDDGLSALERGEIDLYGPLTSTPLRLSRANFIRPFNKVALSGVFRLKPANGLQELPEPRTLKDLRARPYKIAVLKDTAAHQFALTTLNKNDDSILVCESPEETLERVLMSGIPRPAHLMICDSINAIPIINQNKASLSLIFGTQNTALAYLDTAIAVRTDWPELLHILNDAIEFIENSGALENLLERYRSEEYKSLVTL